MLRDTDFKVKLAGIEDANTSPHRNLDTCIDTAHSTRESPARKGIDSESYDPEIQSTQQSYETEEF
jgi:hypothetical protein